jgi:hypothetical protein
MSTSHIHVSSSVITSNFPRISDISNRSHTPIISVEYKNASNSSMGNRGDERYKLKSFKEERMKRKLIK